MVGQNVFSVWYERLDHSSGVLGRSRGLTGNLKLVGSPLALTRNLGHNCREGELK